VAWFLDAERFGLCMRKEGKHNTSHVLLLAFTPHAAHGLLVVRRIPAEIGRYRFDVVVEVKTWCSRCGRMPPPTPERQRRRNALLQATAQLGGYWYCSLFCTFVRNHLHEVLGSPGVQQNEAVGANDVQPAPACR